MPAMDKFLQWRLTLPRLEFDGLLQLQHTLSKPKFDDFLGRRLLTVWMEIVDVECSEGQSVLRAYDTLEHGMVETPGL
jgi:hypothetical protein